MLLYSSLLECLGETMMSIDRKAFTDESADFVQWCLMKKDRVSASGAERFLEKLGLEKQIAVPGAGPKRGPLELGELVRVDKTKNTDSANVDACEKYHDHVGNIFDVNPGNVVVQFPNHERVQFIGNTSGASTGLYRHSPAEMADKPGRAVIEVVYVSDKTAPPPSADRIEMVREYVEKGLATGESRVDIYYTGLPFKMADGKSGFYFSFFPTQRSTPISGAYPRSINPTKGDLYYLGVLGHRPGGWKAEYEKMVGAPAGADQHAVMASGNLRDTLVKLAHDVPEMRKHLVPILRCE